MKHKLNNIDFKTWNSWNMPYYTETVRRLPDNNLERHLEKSEAKSNALWLIILMLCATIIIMKWEDIKAFFEKLEQGSETKSDSEKMDDETS